MPELHGSTILVVGATGGLGREIARQLSDAGATLVLSARDPAAIAELGLPGAVIPADLTDPAAVRRLVDVAVSVTGHLDGIVVAAGVVAFGPASELTGDTIARLFAVNTTAPMLLLQAAHGPLSASAAAGRAPFFLTLSGVVSESPTANLAAYSASKAALAAFGTAAGRELRRAGIRVIDARPGHTETALSSHPISGTAPPLPVGLDPVAVCARIVRGLADGDRDLPSTVFAAAAPR
ncbi:MULTISPECIES: SDR family NAD(P)-dependent oxidoreductase [Cryobacterium]|uniref:Short-chain dehydrogenase n=1 Tax=Cryobacterium zongtaii TaxID=1259217 RepID=A0A2S3ZIA7_9MICO|nr:MULTISPECIES: SDR family NAD(P)-dependent oxidoreductase [Cryobacterium]POH65402.1 short-chain dehydrogenase [Cryobacterium zongtaii]POH67319.1 short-chain dehydrogenase [Cryobacterium zongtaii]TFC45101.1 SDR family NAD(P)-dependent oxidoreductase [Cryobacterium sp. TMN-39-2]